MGMRAPLAGQIMLDGEGDIAGRPPEQRRGLAVAVIPADRASLALAGSLSIAENYAVGGLESGRYGSKFRLRRGPHARGHGAGGEGIRRAGGARPGAKGGFAVWRQRAEAGAGAGVRPEARNWCWRIARSRGLDVRASADVQRRLLAARGGGRGGPADQRRSGGSPGPVRPRRRAQPRPVGRAAGCAGRPPGDRPGRWSAMPEAAVKPGWAPPPASWWEVRESPSAWLRAGVLALAVGVGVALSRRGG